MNRIQASLFRSVKEWVAVYDLEEIKLFLKAMKNRRGVRVNDYFPDLKQFVEKTRCLMTEGLFNNKEVYRLKKLVRKLNNEMSDGAEKS